MLDLRLWSKKADCKVSFETLNVLRGRLMSKIVFMMGHFFATAGAAMCNVYYAIHVTCFT